jgi:NAD(P)H dehydrogenase (quinone)
MKRVLIIHAHPEKQSFCSALKDLAITHFQNSGAEIKISDLYKTGFNPVGDKNDFLELSNPAFFKYQAEQTHAFQNDLFSPEVKAEMEKFIWCDTLIFTFPLWWFGLPAILKGWVDRILLWALLTEQAKVFMITVHLKIRLPLLLLQPAALR